MGENLPELENLTNLILGPEFTELTQSQDTYCPFDALKVSNSEIRHSNFLANALDLLRLTALAKPYWHHSGLHV